MLVLLLLLLLIQDTESTGNCTQSFILERNTASTGYILNRSPVSGLRECASLCKTNSLCSGFNYVINSEEGALCLQMHEARNSNDTTPSLRETVLYAGTKIGLTEKCGKRSFAFEKYRERTVLSPHDIIEDISNSSLPICMNTCLQNPLCRSIEYARDIGRCRILSVSMNSVYNTRKSFQFHDNSDIYEATCRDVPMSESYCSWMRLKSAGLPDIYDSKETCDSEDSCERLCVQRGETGDVCRSYTFDSSSKMCFLSQASARMWGRSPLENNKRNLKHGDLDDCIDFSLKCHPESLEVRGASMRQFTGSVKTKRGKETLCSENISASYNFKVHLGFEKCGLEERTTPFSSYKGVVHIKEGSTSLVTIRDKVLQVECRIHQQFEMPDQLLTVSMNVSDTNRTDHMLSDRIILVPSRTAPVPRFSIKVLSKNGSPVDTLRIGEGAWLSVKSNVRNSSPFTVTSLTAKDLKSGTKYPLMNTEGCVTDKTSINSIETVSSSEIRYGISFTRFEDAADIVYSAYVETCHSECQPKCNTDLINTTKHIRTQEVHFSRTRRSITPRQIELTQDVYKIHGTRLTVVREGNFTEEKLKHTTHFPFEQTDEQAVHISPVESTALWSSLHQCIVGDVTCLFTLVLGVVQLLLLTSCLCIVYCYVKEWRRYREAERSMRPSSRLKVETVRNTQDS